MLLNMRLCSRRKIFAVSGHWKESITTPFYNDNGITENGIDKGLLSATLTNISTLRISQRALSSLR